MIPYSPAHGVRLARQVIDNLVGLQRDMLTNAATHKGWAQTQATPLANLQQYVLDCALDYLRRLQWLIDLRNDPVKEPRLLDGLARWNITEADIVNIATPLRQAAVGLRDAPRTSYADIIAACDALTAFVDKPDSLWPE
jgi:hypothetical protein